MEQGGKIKNELLSLNADNWNSGNKCDLSRLSEMKLSILNFTMIYADLPSESQKWESDGEHFSEGYSEQEQKSQT